MEGVTGIADDMVIAGTDEIEHDRNFLAFMENCMSNDLTLNSEKIQFKQSQVSFYGHCWLKPGNLQKCPLCASKICSSKKIINE